MNGTRVVIWLCALISKLTSHSAGCVWRITLSSEGAVGVPSSFGTAKVEKKVARWDGESGKESGDKFRLLKGAEACEEVGFGGLVSLCWLASLLSRSPLSQLGGPLTYDRGGELLELLTC